jgi:hypothetical protein
MKRRHLLRGLLGLGFVAPIPALSKPPDYPGYDEYKGYLIVWSGWIPSQFTAALLGHWCAYSRAKPRKQFYSMSSGHAAPFSPGDHFNCTYMHESLVTNGITPQAELDRVKDRALRHLLFLIDQEG